jgi:hypothetical protein
VTGEIGGIPGDTLIIVSPDEFSWFLNLGGLVAGWAQEMRVVVYMASSRSLSDTMRAIDNRPYGVEFKYLGWKAIPDCPISNNTWLNCWNKGKPKNQCVHSVDEIPAEWMWAVTQGNIEVPGDLLSKAADEIWDCWVDVYDPDSSIPIFPLGTGGPMSEMLYRVSHRFPCLHYLEWPSALHAKKKVEKRAKGRLVHQYQVEDPEIKATYFRRFFRTQTSHFRTAKTLGTEMLVSPAST